jgi:hypothetical protein
VIATFVLLVAFGCGSSGPNVSIGRGPSHARVTPADGATAGSSTRTITYRGVQFDVPSSWPVYDLDANPSTCVRFDVHAVYLGTPGADMNCPAGVVGRTDAVLVGPATGQPPAAGAGALTAQAVNGLSVQVANDASVAHELDVNVPSAGVDAVIAYADSDATAQQILGSFRPAGQ